MHADIIQENNLTLKACQWC